MRDARVGYSLVFLETKRLTLLHCPLQILQKLLCLIILFNVRAPILLCSSHSFLINIPLFKNILHLSERPQSKKATYFIPYTWFDFYRDFFAWACYTISKPPLSYLISLILPFWLFFVMYPNPRVFYNIKKKKLYEESICDCNVSVVDSKIANAFTNMIARKIYVTNTFIQILTPEEICAVLEHEKGHLANKYLNTGVGVVQTISFSTFVFLSLLVILTLFKPAVELLRIYLGMYVIFYLTTLIATMWFWLNEHEADLNSSRKEALISALTKMEMYNKLTQYYKISPEKFSELKISDLKLKEVRLRNVIREILALPKVTLKLPIMHPPTSFRVFLLSNASKIKSNEM